MTVPEQHGDWAGREVCRFWVVNPSPSLYSAWVLNTRRAMLAASSDDMSSAQAAEPAVKPEMAEDPRVARILAKSLFRDMKASGIPRSRILEVASELIGLVTSELNAANGAEASAKNDDN